MITKKERDVITKELLRRDGVSEAMFKLDGTIHVRGTMQNAKKPWWMYVGHILDSEFRQLLEQELEKEKKA